MSIQDAAERATPPSDPGRDGDAAETAGSADPEATERTSVEQASAQSIGTHRARARNGETASTAAGSGATAGSAASADALAWLPTAGPLSRTTPPEWEAIIAGRGYERPRTSRSRSRVPVSVGIGLVVVALGAAAAIVIPIMTAALGRSVDFTVRVASQEDLDAAGIVLPEEGGWAWEISLATPCDAAGAEAEVHFSSVANGETELTRDYRLDNGLDEQLLIIERIDLPAYAVLDAVNCVR